MFFLFFSAQRLQETGYGRRLDTYRFADQQLLDAIEELLADRKLAQRLQAAATRIQSSRRHEELAEKLEDMFAYSEVDKDKEEDSKDGKS